jgi:amino-acid N-acetyltransferase
MRGDLGYHEARGASIPAVAAHRELGRHDEGNVASTSRNPARSPERRADPVPEVHYRLAVPVLVRPARTADVPAIKSLVDIYAGTGRKLLAKDLVTLYEDVQDFVVAERDATVVGCGALHVLWADLGEIRTLAVHPGHQNLRIGQQLLEALVETARGLGLQRLFALTFHTAFFARAGFVEIEGAPVDHETYEALRRSYDPGVAEFLGLEYVKPNTLGNTRMLLRLQP